MLQQFNPMCRTVEVLWGERHVPWDIQEKISPAGPNTWCWRDEPPPTRIDYIVASDTCLYMINRLYNPKGYNRATHLPRPDRTHWPFTFAIHHNDTHR